jgi:hypothetical protein
MLEEIIEYIKFLQLQTKVRMHCCSQFCSVNYLLLLLKSQLTPLICLKVLSMSRLGATEAVVPLLMESQDEVQ